MEACKKEEKLVELFLSGKVFYHDKQVDINSLNWNPHPTFKGVALKHIIEGNYTGNQLSCHIVRVDAGCVLDTHIHKGKFEIHEVVSGDGTCILDGKEIKYVEGTLCVIPADTPHKVVAGKNGLYLFAKFTPAL